MNFAGIIIGAITIGSIALYHPLVIKTEYLIGLKAKWVFITIGVISVAAFFLTHFLAYPDSDRQIAEIGLTVFAFSSFWSAYEVGLQHKRVLKGRFPKNPAHPEFYR